MLKDTVKKDAPKEDAPKEDAPKEDAPKEDAPKEEAFEVSRLETVPTHSKVTITDGMKEAGWICFRLEMPVLNLSP